MCCTGCGKLNNMAKQTPNLKKLEEKFEALFKEETEESFNKWLADKQQNIKPNNMAQQTHTSQFKNWVEELLTEEEGREIAAQGITYLQILYERCTGKLPFKIK
jgi:hypothetical protein